jgi:uncharacterized protein YcbK (DUF882 family)
MMSEPMPDTPQPITRRRLLRSTAIASVGLGLLPAGLRALTGDARELTFHHLHTGESLRVVYREPQGYVPEALEALSRLLRDHRTGDEYPIEPELFDLVHDVQSTAGGAGTIRVISGYRSRRTNEHLRKQGRTVASRSLHLVGKAIDLRMDGVPSERLRTVALDLRRGGVGYYPRSDFVHLDVGRFRTW